MSKKIAGLPSGSINLGIMESTFSSPDRASSKPCFGWEILKKNLITNEIRDVLMQFDRSRGINHKMNIFEIEERYVGYWLGFMPELYQLLADVTGKTVYIFETTTSGWSRPMYDQSTRYEFIPNEIKYKQEFVIL